MGAFEDFVNTELPLRISTKENGGGSGNLPADKFLLTTGIGLGVKTVSSTPSTCPEAIIANNFDLAVDLLGNLIYAVSENP